ncbi:MAG: hypothetical protein WD355_00980 [Balneolaceae bacterium]
MEELSFRWFTVCYLALGLLLITGGTYTLTRLSMLRGYVTGAARHEHPPTIWIKTIRYLLLFTLPSLVLSFFPFSWVELIFSIWCLIIVYTAGQMLAYWKQTANMILDNQDAIPGKLKLIAANMISIGLILFLLCYHLLSTRGTG